MELERRDLFKAAAAGAVGITALAATSAWAEGTAETPTEVPYTVELDGTEPVAEAQDNVAYNTAKGSEAPDYGAQINHVFGLDRMMDYYFFDGFTGLGVAEYCEAKIQDLIMVTAGGTMSDVCLKDGAAGDLQSLIVDVRSAVYTTADGVDVPLKFQTCHGANPKYDGMVVYTTNKPGKLNKSLSINLGSFDSEELPQGINYLLGNPDSGKHNTDGTDNGFSETQLKFWYNENDDCPTGLQYIYTKYAVNGGNAAWLYVKSANRVDVRFRDLGTGEKGSAEYVEGTTLNMSVYNPDEVKATVTVDDNVPGRCFFQIPIDETFYFDPEDPTVVQNAKLSNEREFLYRAEVVADTNTALIGDVSVMCDRNQPKNLFFAIQAEGLQSGEFELAVWCSAHRATGYPTEWSEIPAVIKVQVA